VENQGQFESVNESSVRIYDIGRHRHDDDEVCTSKIIDFLIALIFSPHCRKLSMKTRNKWMTVTIRLRPPPCPRIPPICPAKIMMGTETTMTITTTMEEPEEEVEGQRP
jgi:hypothetical protein